MFRKIVTVIAVMVITAGVALAADTLQEATKLAKDGKYDQSIAMFNRLIKQEDGNPNYIYNRAIVYELKKDTKSAIADYDYLIKEYPSSGVAVSAHGKLARIYKLQGDEKSSKQHVYAALKLKNQNSLEETNESQLKKKTDEIYNGIK